MTRKMPPISECNVTDCAYNSENMCHTLAITVGGPEECPHCDTYIVALKGGDPEDLGGVGACKARSCTFNSVLECSAPSVRIGWHANHPDCKTFVPKPPRGMV